MIALKRPGTMLILVLSAVFLAVVARTAWIGDDAYITFRVIDNWMNGHGLAWNTAERVQAYTHPLWMFLVAAFYRFTHEPYYTSLILSIALSMAAVLLLAVRVAASASAGALAILIFTFSRAFVDYSTSGLENSLLHALLALFLVVVFGMSRSPRRLLALTLTASLVAMTRLDALLLCAPVIAVDAYALRSRRALVNLLLGFTPLILWTLFSLYYYGFPFPNTAYAKLNTGIARGELLAQGLWYFVDSLSRDPLTLATIAAGLAIAGSRGHRERIPIAAGIALYLIYIIWIGGDFMSGRFLTAPLIAAVAILSRYPLPMRARSTGAMALIILGLGSVPWPPPILSGSSYAVGVGNAIGAHGVADERAYYFQKTGLFRADGGHGVDEDSEAARGRDVRSKGRAVIGSGNIGIFGYYAGPQVHVIDGFALSDPLLARLPIRSLKWRVGHYVREFPAGYAESLAEGRNVIADARIRKFYDRLMEITRGPLLRPDRLRTIWSMNTGRYRSLLAPFYESRRFQNAGQREYDAGRFDQAISALTRAVELDSTRAPSWFLLSTAFVKTQRLDDARDALNRAIRLQPGAYEEALMDLAGAYIKAGDAAEGVAALERYVAARPDSPRGHAFLGSTYEQLGDVARAIQHYERALELNPEAPELRKHLQALTR